MTSKLDQIDDAPVGKEASMASTLVEYVLTMPLYSVLLLISLILVGFILYYAGMLYYTGSLINFFLALLSGALLVGSGWLMQMQLES